jgi:hypothetical protein
VSPPVFHRRPAERLARLLDEADGGPRRQGHGSLDGELAGYVQLGDRLRGTAGLLTGPSQEFRTSLRARLVATAQREGIGGEAADDPPDPPDPPDPGGQRAPLVVSRRAKGAVLVGLAAGTLALSGMSAASGSALPGDPLYTVKRSTENARLALAGSDVSKGELYLEFARNRLHEVRGTEAPRAGAFDDMDSETRDGVRLLLSDAIGRHDSTALDAIDGFLRAQRVELARFGGNARVLQSVALLERVAARSAAVRANLGCATGTGTADDLGPLAPACPTIAVPGPGRWGGNPGPGTAPHTAGPPGATEPSIGAGTPGTASSPAGPYASPSPASPSAGPSGLLGHVIDGVR